MPFTFLFVSFVQAVLASKGEKRAVSVKDGEGSAPSLPDATETPKSATGTPLAPRPPPPPSPKGQQDGEEKGDNEETGEKGQQKKGDAEADEEGECKARHQQSDDNSKGVEGKNNDCDRTEGAEEDKIGGQEEEEETEEEREQRREQRADVNRHMAKLYITVLQAKYQEQSRQGGGEFSRVRRHEDGREDDSKLGLGFASLDIGELPMCDPSTVPADFESVRDVFKKAKVGNSSMPLVWFRSCVHGLGVSG